jgi:hypothetical protein
LSEENTEDDQAKDPIEANIEGLKVEQGKLDEGIKQGDTQTKEFAGGVDKEAERVSAQLVADGKRLLQFHSETSANLVSGLSTARSKIVKTLAKSSYSLRAYIGMQVVLLSLIGILGGYYASGFGLGPLGIFATAWVVVSLIVVLEAHSQLSRFSDHSRDIVESVDSFNTNVAEKISKFPEPMQDTSQLHNMVSMLRDAASEVVATASKFNPLIEKMVDVEGEKLQRDQFVDKFSYALKRYGFDSYSKTARLAFIMKLRSATNEGAALEQLASVAEAGFKKPSKLFVLMYYETWNKDNIGAAWDDVRNSEAMRTSLAQVLIDHGIISTRELSERSKASVSDLLLHTDNFDLIDTRNRADEFLEQLSSFKLDCLDVLDSYNLSVVINKDELMTLPPDSSDPSRWRDQVINYLAARIPKVLLGAEVGVDASQQTEEKQGSPATDESGPERLILLEGLGDAGRITLWKQITQSERADLSLIRVRDLLTKKKIRKPFPDFSSATFGQHLLVVLKASSDDFLLQPIQEALESMEEEILSVRRGMGKASDRFRLGLNDFEFVNRFVPVGIDSVEKELLSTLASKSGSTFELASLLYYDATGSDRADEVFREMRKAGTLNSIADFLIEKEFIPIGRFNKSLSTLISTQPSFNLPSFLEVYSKYGTLMNKLDAFATFVKAHEIGNAGGTPTFQEVLKQCPSTDPLSLVDMLVKITITMVTDELGGVRLTTEEHQQLAKAACALSLQLENDTNSEILAKQLAKEFYRYGASVLYVYSKLMTQDVSKENPPTLARASVQALTEKTKASLENDPNFEFFVEKLFGGLIVQGANLLMAMRREEYDAMRRRAEELGLENKILENYVGSNRELLSAMPINVTRDFLTDEVLSAFIITIPHSAALIGFMEEYEQQLIAAADYLSSERKDSRYGSLLRVKKIGMAARIGLVPLGLKFEKFSRMLDELFEEVRTRTGNERLPSFFVTRIFPSEDAMKVVNLAGFKGKEPIQVVQDLVQENLDGYDGAALLSLSEPTPKITSAFISVMVKLIDGKGNNLYTLTKDLVSDTVEMNKGLKEIFSESKIDKGLLGAYSAQSITEMCKKIQEKVDATDEGIVKSDFETKLTGVVPEISGLSAPQRAILVAELFRRLRIVGTVLFSREMVAKAHQTMLGTSTT